MDGSSLMRPGGPADEEARLAAIRCLWQLGPTETEPRDPYLYCVLDAAKDERIYPTLAAFAAEYEMASLYGGQAASDFATVAPYLVCLGTDVRLFDWIWREGWGRGWGIFAWSLSIFETVRDHFRRLTTVKLESGEVVLFRFYDPVVLDLFAPTFDAAQLAELIGPLNCLMTVGGDGAPERVLRHPIPKLDLGSQ
jgi:hypothetical protein